MDLALNNRQRLICHKTSAPNPQPNPSLYKDSSGIIQLIAGWYAIKPNQPTFLKDMKL